MADELLKWQTRYTKAKDAYGLELNKMDDRELLYKGTRDVDKITASGETVKAAKKSHHIRNVVFELIESQVDSTIPIPKVIALREEHQDLAREIEDSITADIDRLPLEVLNDMQERTTPIQGGSFFLVEWDNSISTHNTIGDLHVSIVHPKNVIPQPGVYDIYQADYLFIRMERTKDYIKRRYDVDVDAENVTEQGISTLNPETNTEDKVVQVLCYYKNKDGIGLFSWVNDVVVEDLPDYQARQMDKCQNCGLEKKDKDKCECGGSFKRQSATTETLSAPIMVRGTVIDVGTELPYYKPNRYPIILRKNVSAYGQLLGDSDTDKIRDQQMLINKLGSKIEEKLLKGGSYVTMPRGARLRRDDSELKVYEVDSPDAVNMIKVINLQPNVNMDSGVLANVYNSAQSTLGITDTFQGKPDPTAESGKAKQLLIEQATGRLESKRKMKAAAYAELFELMFKFKLAYTDEPRPYRTDSVGIEPQYGTFSRYDFLMQDAAGEWYYNDNFLFSTDPAGALGQNRQMMWEELRRNFQEGALGNPQDPQTLLMFWQMMETMSYPMAGKIIGHVKEQMEQQQQMLQMQQMQQQVQPQVPQDIDAELEVLLGG